MYYKNGFEAFPSLPSTELQLAFLNDIVLT